MLKHMSCLLGNSDRSKWILTVVMKPSLKGQQVAKWSNKSQYSKLKKTIETQPVRRTEVCGKE